MSIFDELRRLDRPRGPRNGVPISPDVLAAYEQRHDVRLGFRNATHGLDELRVQLQSLSSSGLFRRFNEIVTMRAAAGEPVILPAGTTVNLDRDRFDVTAFGDVNRRFLVGETRVRIRFENDHVVWDEL